MDKIPSLFYGTAWKELETERLVLEALETGFVAIDTANQRKHYFEEAVGRALQRFLAKGRVKREQLFLQTKFTYQRGQDHRLPYDPKASFDVQVRQSFESSLQHFDTTFLDSYILHGPYDREGIGDEDRSVWTQMERLYEDRKIKNLGVSNVHLEQLQELYVFAKIKPRFVQNRCFAATGWDYEVRKFCREKNILYQGFSLLTANSRELTHPLFQSLSSKYKKTIPQIVFKFSIQLGMIVITGTTNKQHMAQDLAMDDFELIPDEVAQIERITLSL